MKEKEKRKRKRKRRVKHSEAVKEANRVRGRRGERGESAGERGDEGVSASVNLVSTAHTYVNQKSGLNMYAQVDSQFAHPVQQHTCYRPPFPTPNPSCLRDRCHSEIYYTSSRQMPHIPFGALRQATRRVK